MRRPKREKPPAPAPGKPDADAEKPRRARNRKYARARVRHFLFTVGPDRVTGGRLTRRHAAKQVVLREIDVPTPRWPASFDGLRIGHVSDFHLGDLLPIDRALQIVKQLADQKPDLVACTGDVVDLDHRGAQRLLDALAGIGAPMGTLLVLGNHDELHDPDHLADMAHRAGVTVLRNEAVHIKRNGNTIVAAGIEWSRSALGCARHIDQAGADCASLLLAHNPKAFLRAADLGVPLTLAGHTHGGQVALRNRPNTNLALLHRRSAGLFESGGSMMYVTAGIGAWFPLRVNCPPEIAMLTLRHHQGDPDADADAA